MNEDRLREIVATVADGKVVHKVDVAWLVPQARVWFTQLQRISNHADLLEKDDLVRLAKEAIR